MGDAIRLGAFMFVMIHTMRYWRKKSREEINHDELVLEIEVESSDDKS